jgi:hypothetical protein
MSPTLALVAGSPLCRARLLAYSARFFAKKSLAYVTAFCYRQHQDSGRAEIGWSSSNLGSVGSWDRSRDVSVAMPTSVPVPGSAHGPTKEPLSLSLRRCGTSLHPPMNSRICRCCGEPMPNDGNALSRNPNVCASCSSMADGMDAPSMSNRVSLSPSAARTAAQAPPEEHPAETRTHFAPA